MTIPGAAHHWACCRHLLSALHRRRLGCLSGTHSSSFFVFAQNLKGNQTNHLWVRLSSCLARSMSSVIYVQPTLVRPFNTQPAWSNTFVQHGRLVNATTMVQVHIDGWTSRVEFWNKNNWFKNWASVLCETLKSKICIWCYRNPPPTGLQIPLHFSHYNPFPPLSTPSNPPPHPLITTHTALFHLPTHHNGWTWPPSPHSATGAPIVNPSLQIHCSPHKHNRIKTLQPQVQISL